MTDRQKESSDDKQSWVKISPLCGAFRRIFSLVYGNQTFICIRILPITDIGIKKQTACEGRLLII